MTNIIACLLGLAIGIAFGFLLGMVWEIHETHQRR